MQNRRDMTKKATPASPNGVERKNWNPNRNLSNNDTDENEVNENIDEQNKSEEPAEEENVSSEPESRGGFLANPGRSIVNASKKAIDFIRWLIGFLMRHPELLLLFATILFLFIIIIIFVLGIVDGGKNHTNGGEDNYNLTENDAYWWPIGSSSAMNDNIYGATPVNSTITSSFGPRKDPITGVENSGHGAIDIGVPRNTPVISTKDGTVVLVNTGCTEGNLSCGGGYGNYVKIDHGKGIESLYAHLNSLEVKNGDIVKQGQLIAYSGSTGRSTGPHLHFEIRLNGTKVDPEDYVSINNPRPTNSIQPAVTGVTGDYKNMLCSSLLASGFSKESTIGIMANISAESSYSPINLESIYETKLGYDDSSYTLAVDDGSYTNFVNDSAGYGLVQWTSSGRKKGLYDYAKYKNTSIGDFDMQFNYMLQELEKSYPSTYKYATGNYTAIELGAYWCDHYEVPAGSEPCSVQGNCPSQHCVNRTTNTINSGSLTEYVNNGCK